MKNQVNQRNITEKTEEIITGRKTQNATSAIRLATLVKNVDNMLIGNTIRKKLIPSREKIILRQAKVTSL